jgi:hypothetical protein
MYLQLYNGLKKIVTQFNQYLYDTERPIATISQLTHLPVDNVSDKTVATKRNKTHSQPSSAVRQPHPFPSVTASQVSPAASNEHVSAYRAARPTISIPQTGLEPKNKGPHNATRPGRGRKPQDPAYGPLSPRSRQRRRRDRLKAAKTEAAKSNLIPKSSRPVSQQQAAQSQARLAYRQHVSKIDYRRYQPIKAKPSNARPEPKGNENDGTFYRVTVQKVAIYLPR